jgi:hypothetical protein
MNFVSAKVKHVTVGRETLRVELQDGRVISVPLAWYPTLVHAAIAEVRRWKPCGAGTGIFWPALDYHLSIEGLLRGAHEAEGVTRRARVAA